jgi:hypothetical protein
MKIQKPTLKGDFMQEKVSKGGKMPISKLSSIIFIAIWILTICISFYLGYLCAYSEIITTISELTRETESFNYSKTIPAWGSGFDALSKQEI